MKMSKVNLKKVGVNNPILGDVQRIDENFTDVEVAINDLEDNKASQSYVDDKIGNIDFDNLAPKDSVYDKATSDNRFAPKQHTHKISDVVGLSDELESSGLTLVNLIENGDFSDGTTGWISAFANTPVVSDGVLTFRATSLWGQVNCSNLPMKKDEKMYYKVAVKSDAKVWLSYNGAASLPRHSGNGQWEILSVVKTIPEDTWNGRTGVIDHRTSGWSDIQLKDVMIINLTQTFGADNEPTKQEMDKLIETLGVEYFEEITVTKLQSINWLLKLIRQNALATTSLGGTIL